MSARDDILSRLRLQVRDVSPPPAWKSRRSYENLSDQFIEALMAAKGEVLRADNLESAFLQLGYLLRDLDARRVVANDEAPLTVTDLPARWPTVAWHAVGRTNDDLRAFCASADAGISGASAALAETGSVLIESGPGRSRLATLLPPVHVALVGTSQLTADIFTWAAVRKEQPPSSLTLISGPSKTADIEQTLAVGVHGPRRFIVILYDD